MKSNTLVIIGILIFCIGGFFAGRLSSPTPTADTSVATSTPPPRPNRNTSVSSDANITKVTKKIDRPKGTSKKKDVNLEAMMRGVDAVERCQQLLAFIDDLRPNDFEAALNEFRRTGVSSQHSSEYSMLLSAWAKIDPIAALEYAKSETNSSFETTTILATWATHDPEAAIRWANEIHDGEGANPHLIGVIRALASTDLDRSTELLLSMPRSSERGSAFDGVQSALLSKGLIATQEWLDNLPDPVFRNDAMTRLVSSLAYTDPQKALELMDQQSTAVSQQITLSFVSRAFYNNPQIAVDNIVRLQDENSRKSAYSSYVQSWIRKDKTAALQWLAQNTGKDPSLQSLYLKHQ